jgi:hypothetical protein
MTLIERVRLRGILEGLALPALPAPKEPKPPKPPKEPSFGRIPASLSDPVRMMPHGERVIDGLARLRAQANGQTVMTAAKQEIYRVSQRGSGGGRANVENYVLGVLYGPSVFPWPKKGRAKPAVPPTLRELIAQGKREAAEGAALDGSPLH